MLQGNRQNYFLLFLQIELSLLLLEICCDWKFWFYFFISSIFILLIESKSYSKAYPSSFADLAEKLMPSVVNIGMGSDNSINQYYNVVAKVMGYKGSFFHDYDKPTGMSQKLVSINKQTTWGWRPTHDLIEGIKLTYEYYLQEKKHEV